MQWTPGRNGGFSNARPEDLRVPTISSGRFGFRNVNVESEERDPDSLLNWLARALRLRRSLPAFGRGDWEALGTGDRAVLALRFRYADTDTVALHNFADQPRRADLRPAFERAALHDLFADRHYEDEDAKSFELGPYGYRWLETHPVQSR
jgi:maltose alpha-D-glucosyltransferase/alpha-amylase